MDFTLTVEDTATARSRKTNDEFVARTTEIKKNLEKRLANICRVAPGLRLKGMAYRMCVGNGNYNSTLSTTLDLDDLVSNYLCRIGRTGDTEAVNVVKMCIVNEGTIPPSREDLEDLILNRRSGGGYLKLKELGEYRRNRKL